MTNREYLDIWPTPRRVEIARALRAGMPVEPVWELHTFRWRNDDGDESSTGASFAADEVTNLTDVVITSGDVDLRLRIGIDQTSTAYTDNAGDPDIVPRLQAKLNSGGTWAAVPISDSSTYVEMDSASGLSDGSATTNHGLTLDHTFGADGTQEENSSDAGTITADLATPGTQESFINEWAITLLSSGLADGDVVYFRVTDAGTLLDNYVHGDASDTNPITVAVIAGAQTFNRELLDSLTLSDTLKRDARNVRGLAESLTLTETLERFKFLPRTLSDSLTLTDNLERAGRHTRALSDSQSLSDNLERIVELNRELAETLTFSEVLGREVVNTRLLLETLTFSENFVSYKIVYAEPGLPTYGLWRRAGRM